MVWLVAIPVPQARVCRDALQGGSMPRYRNTGQQCCCVQVPLHSTANSFGFGSERCPPAPHPPARLHSSWRRLASSTSNTPRTLGRLSLHSRAGQGEAGCHVLGCAGPPARHDLTRPAGDSRAYATATSASAPCCAVLCLRCAALTLCRAVPAHRKHNQALTSAGARPAVRLAQLAGAAHKHLPPRPAAQTPRRPPAAQGGLILQRYERLQQTN